MSFHSLSCCENVGWEKKKSGGHCKEDRSCSCPRNIPTWGVSKSSRSLVVLEARLHAGFTARKLNRKKAPPSLGWDTAGLWLWGVQNLFRMIKLLHRNMIRGKEIMNPARSQSWVRTTSIFLPMSVFREICLPVSLMAQGSATNFSLIPDPKLNIGWWLFFFFLKTCDRK